MKIYKNIKLFIMSTKRKCSDLEDLTEVLPSSSKQQAGEGKFIIFIYFI